MNLMISLNLNIYMPNAEQRYNYKIVIENPDKNGLIKQIVARPASRNADIVFSTRHKMKLALALRKHMGFKFSNLFEVGRNFSLENLPGFLNDKDFKLPKAMYDYLKVAIPGLEMPNGELQYNEDRHTAIFCSDHHQNGRAQIFDIKEDDPLVTPHLGTPPIVSGKYQRNVDVTVANEATAVPERQDQESTTPDIAQPIATSPMERASLTQGTSPIEPRPTRAASRDLTIQNPKKDGWIKEITICKNWEGFNFRVDVQFNTPKLSANPRTGFGMTGFTNFTMNQAIGLGLGPFSARVYESGFMMEQFAEFLNNSRNQFPQEMLNFIRIAIPGLSQNNNGLFSYNRTLDDQGVQRDNYNSRVVEAAELYSRGRSAVSGEQISATSSSLGVGGRLFQSTEGATSRQQPLGEATTLPQRRVRVI